MKIESILKSERKAFHKALLESVLIIDGSGVPSNADRSQRSSILYAQGIATRLSSETGERLAGQTSGHKFEKIVADFLENTFKRLSHLRPGKWSIFQVRNRNGLKIADYAQYEHLVYLQAAATTNMEILASLGNDYTISPDIIISRERESDLEINMNQVFVDEFTAKLAAIRLASGSSPILHASISTKWTIRSDRAQNSRAEALNLIRNRKGHLPHIVVVTGEPTPSRLSSIALGTGDIDCVYHFALDELKESVVESGNDEAIHMLEIMIKGKRLKDISDLPLDLIV